MEVTPRGNETRLLYAGPLDNSKAVFGVGKYHLFAEIHEEAGAYTVYDIDTTFVTVLPTREGFRLKKNVCKRYEILQMDLGKPQKKLFS